MKIPLPLKIVNSQIRDIKGSPCKILSANLNINDTLEKKSSEERISEIKRISAAGYNLLNINIDARKICTESGDLVPGSFLNSFDEILETCLNLEMAVVITLMAFINKDDGNTAPHGSFSNFYQNGMLFWHEQSTIVQERYTGQFLLRKTGSGRYLFEYPNIAAIRLYDNTEAILDGMLRYLEAGEPPEKLPYLDDFMEHRERYFRIRGDLPESKRADAFRDHIMRRQLMFMSPEILHAFGNRCIHILSGCPGNNLSIEMKKLETELFELASTYGFSPCVREFEAGILLDKIPE